MLCAGCGLQRRCNVLPPLCMKHCLLLSMHQSALCMQGLPYRMAADAAAAGVLDSATQLEYFCCSGWPEQHDELAGNGSWDAFWSFLRRHPPLRCVTVDTDLVPGSAASPNAAAVDALLDLWTCRPELQLRRTPRPNVAAQAESFWIELLHHECIPKGAGA